jgi:hypothetical protein
MKRKQQHDYHKRMPLEKKTKNDSIHQEIIIHGIKDNDVSSNINV